MASMNGLEIAAVVCVVLGTGLCVFGIVKDWRG